MWACQGCRKPQANDQDQETPNSETAEPVSKNKSNKYPRQGSQERAGGEVRDRPAERTEEGPAHASSGLAVMAGSRAGRTASSRAPSRQFETTWRQDAGETRRTQNGATSRPKHRQAKAKRVKGQWKPMRQQDYLCHERQTRVRGLRYYVKERVQVFRAHSKKRIQQRKRGDEPAQRKIRTRPKARRASSERYI